MNKSPADRGQTWLIYRVDVALNQIHIINVEEEKSKCELPLLQQSH